MLDPSFTGDDGREDDVSVGVSGLLRALGNKERVVRLGSGAANQKSGSVHNTREESGEV